MKNCLECVIDILITLKNCIFSIVYGMIFLFILLIAPLLFGYHPTVVLTGSMNPTFKTGSLIYYQEAAASDIQKGDLLVFKFDNGEIVTHRVVDKVNDKFITKGDANNTNDSKPVKSENVIGKACNVNILFVGYILGYLYNHVYIIFIVISLLLLDFIFSNRGTRKKENSNDSIC